MDDDLTLDSASPFGDALGVDPDDPEVARACAAIAARLLGVPTAPASMGRYILLERLGAGGMGIVYAAYDPELDRKVALKLLFRRDASDSERQRLVREAKAMAKLAHPNVVHVYDAGEHEGRVFVAMELVRGETLRAWTRSRQRPALEILKMCLQAGHGLAAAHRAGIIHRDFKPDNVIIGEDGRARVLDFGLARGVAAAAEETSAGEPSHGFDPPAALTCTGAVLGTPGYIAPEQLRGAAADVFCDQFSFCATVWEALTGALPYPRECHGAPDGPWRIVSPPRGAMPRWVERALRRGLGESGRFARLDDLLRALRRDPARLRVRALGAAMLLASAGGAFVLGLSSREPLLASAECGGAAEVLGESWPLADREAAMAGVARVDAPYAAVIAPRLRAQLEAYADAWVDRYRDTCLTHRRGEHSTAGHERRLTCLHRAKRALVTVGGMMRDASVAELPGIVLAAAALPDPILCEEIEGPADSIESPPPGARAIGERLSEVQTLLHAGAAAEAERLVGGVVADARALGHAPLLAEALLTEGKVAIDNGHREAAVAPLRDAVAVALRSHADELAIEAWGQQAWAIATGEAGDVDQVLGARELVLAIADRYPRSFATLSLYNNLAGLELSLHNRDGAREMYERVRALAPGVVDRRADRSLAQALGGLAEFEADPVARVRMGRDAVALMAAVAGPEHPRTLMLQRTTAVLHPEVGDALEDITRACDDTRRIHGDDQAMLAPCLQLQAVLAELHGDLERGRAATRTWARLSDERSRPVASAYLALREGDAVTASTRFAEVVAELEALPTRPWWIETELGESEVALGRARRMLGHADGAAIIERGLRRLEGDGRRLSPRGAWIVLHARAVLAGTIGAT